MDCFSLQGKTALVTGASRGIGEAIARMLASCGARMILISRKIEGLRCVEEEIRRAGGEAESLACHAGDVAQIDALFGELDRKSVV
jgi:NAD(P)-dependent dehydrogenase (short-subunit alcohol dehydrogenase family)